MMKDGIPGTVTMVALLINLVMYTLALLFLGILSFLLKFHMILEFSMVSKIFIVIGIIVLIFSCMGVFHAS